MEKRFSLIQTIATAAAFSAVSAWYGFMFGRESARKELSKLIHDLRRDAGIRVDSEDGRRWTESNNTMEVSKCCSMDQLLQPMLHGFSLHYPLQRNMFFCGW